MKKTGFAFVLLSFALVGTSCRDAERWLRAYGYTAIRPASSLLMPGSLLMRNENTNDGARLICDAPASLGQTFAPTMSNTINGKFRHAKNVSWKVSADVLSQIKANVNASDVDEVTVNVVNARIAHVNDEQIYSNVINRSKACAAAITARKNAGYSITMVKSALIGDVTYNISWKRNSVIDASAKVQQAANVAVSLGGTLDTVTEETASATGLIWGIQEDMFLAAISISPEEARRMKRNTRMLPPDLVIEAQPNAGADNEIKGLSKM